MDKIVPQLGEPRICPECERWLKFWKGQYLCTDCWILLTYEETLKHPHPEGLCSFVESRCDFGMHFTCRTCSKSFLVSNADLLEHEKKMDLLFRYENVGLKRKEEEDWDIRIHEEVEVLKRKDQQVKELFVQWKKI